MTLFQALLDSQTSYWAIGLTLAPYKAFWGREGVPVVDDVTVGNPGDGEAVAPTALSDVQGILAGPRGGRWWS